MIDSDADLSKARATVRATLAGRPDDLVDAGELVVSELVTNALLHGGGVASVTVSVTGSTLRIEVADRNRHAPVPASAPSDAMTGRGLSLVRDLATRWGVTPNVHGKTVWAEIDAEEIRPDHRSAEEILDAWGDIDGTEPERTVRVALGDVPTDLLVAAKRHVDNLVREFALAARGEQSGATAPVPAPLAALIERIVDRFESARLEMKRQANAALEQGLPRTNLVLHLSADTADAAEEYLHALDEIDAYCRANRLLTLETPPQHRIFRQWYIGEIAKQVRAATAGTGPVEPVSFDDGVVGDD